MSKPGTPALALETKAVMTYTDGLKAHRPLSIPVQHAVNFQCATSPQLGEGFRNGSPFVYQRFGHPTSQAAAEKIALLEGGEAGLVFGSGMGAISTGLMALAGVSGSHVIAQRDIFAQTYSFLHEVMRGLGVKTTFFDMQDMDGLRRLIQPETKLIYIESPSNPLITITDIASVSAVAKEHNILVMIDSTFASPYLQNPLQLGADLVLHSGTKFLGGHSDVMCGVAAGSASLIRRVAEMQIMLGTVLDPNAAWLLLRGIKTLGVRVQRQSDTALAIASLLQAHPSVANVYYPFLESSPYHHIAKKQMKAGGGMLSFEFKSGKRGADAFVEALEVISIATSLGGVESIIEIPKDLDFSEEELGTPASESRVPAGLIRLSVGIEDPGDLLRDVEQALNAAAKA